VKKSEKTEKSESDEIIKKKDSKKRSSTPRDKSPPDRAGNTKTKGEKDKKTGPTSLKGGKGRKDLHSRSKSGDTKNKKRILIPMVPSPK